MTNKNMNRGVLLVAVGIALIGLPTGDSALVPPIVYQTAGETADIEYDVADSDATDDFRWECMSTVCFGDLDDVDRDTDVCHDDPMIDGSAFTMRSGTTRKLVIHDDLATSEGITCDTSLTVADDGGAWDQLSFSKCQKGEGAALTGCAAFDVDAGSASGIYYCVPGTAEGENQPFECRDFRMNGAAWNKVAGIGAVVDAYGYIQGSWPMHDTCAFDGILNNKCYVEDSRLGYPYPKIAGYVCLQGTLTATFTVGGTIVLDRNDHCY